MPNIISEAILNNPGTFCMSILLSPFFIRAVYKTGIFGKYTATVKKMDGKLIYIKNGNRCEIRSLPYVHNGILLDKITLYRADKKEDNYYYGIELYYTFKTIELKYED